MSRLGSPEDWLCPSLRVCAHLHHNGCCLNCLILLSLTMVIGLERKEHAAVFKYLFSQYIFSLFNELFWFYFLQCRKHLYRYHHFCAHKSGFIFKHFYKRNILSHGNRNTIVIGSNHKLIGRFFNHDNFEIIFLTAGVVVFLMVLKKLSGTVVGVGFWGSTTDLQKILIMF